MHGHVDSALHIQQHRHHHLLRQCVEALDTSHNVLKTNTASFVVRLSVSYLLLTAPSIMTLTTPLTPRLCENVLFANPQNSTAASNTANSSRDINKVESS